MAGSLGTLSGQLRLDIRQAVAAYAAVRAQNQRTAYALRGTGDSFVRSGQTMAVGGAAMLYAFGRVVNAAAEFERKMDFASAVSNTTGAEMQRLSDYALQLGQDTIYSAGEIADGFIELAKAGVSAEQIIGGIGEAMANLAAAGDIPLAQSGQIITSTIQQFDLEANKAVRVTDLLAGAANASIADISDIGVSLKYVGGVANAAGLGLEDTTTAISLLAKAGIRGSTAGTSLRQMIVSLGGATGPAREALSELGILSEDGSNKFFDQQGNAKSLSQVFQILQNSTEDLTAKQRLAYLRTIFNNRALSAASILTREGAKGFKDMNREMLKTTAADVARERLDNLSGDIEILRGNIETLMIKAGSPFQKELRGWVQAITRLVQAFADLDPKTQETIIRTFAIGGAVLFAMGIFNIIVGTIFRFIASILKMGAALKFIGKAVLAVFRFFKGFDVIGLVRVAFQLLGKAILFLAGKFNLIGLAITAIVIGLVWAYNRFESFRNIVNTIGGALARAGAAVGRFFKLLVTDPKAAWAMLKSGMSSLGAWFATLPGLIGRGLSAAVGFIASWAQTIVTWFQSLPGRIVGYLAGLGSLVASYFTFENVGYALGYLAGTVVKFFATLPFRVLGLLTSLGSIVFNAFMSLVTRIGPALGYMIGFAIGFFIRLHIMAIQWVRSMINRVAAFMATLPGRVVGFIRSMVTRAVGMFIQLAVRLPALARAAKDKVVNFIRNLPQTVPALLRAMATKAVILFTRFKVGAINMAKAAASGFKNAIQNLPSVVSGVVSRIIAAFKSKISAAAAAVRDFASSMWEGFKDGIGMHSPSHFERAMWQITGTIGDETKKLAGQTMNIQKMSRKMAATQFSVKGGEIPQGPAGYRELASMQARNRTRSQMLSETAGKRRARAGAGANRTGRSAGRQRIQITNWRTGEGWMYDIAREAMDDEGNLDDTFDRMG